MATSNQRGRRLSSWFASSPAISKFKRVPDSPLTPSTICAATPSMAPPQCDPLCHFNDRLYFTTFPHPAPQPQLLNTPTAAKHPPPRVRPRSNHVGTSPTPDEDAVYYFFTIDNQLLYLSFFKDWGPLNLAMVYKACILIHELLEDEELKPFRIVLYSSSDPRRKANAALLMALYVMIVQKRAPWEAFQPIAELEFMPFRDAGRGLSDFNLSIQDCLWGMWKAMQNGLCDMNEFNVEDYEHYEKVENGDWNWLTPNFIAFASPVEHGWASKSTQSPANTRKLPVAFQNCLDYFEAHGVKLVVRLNNMLYNRQHFLERGIRHEELYFDDGTNPTDEIVRRFINMADEVIEAGGAIAVHCKAGLGRTGTLIGAYMIWKYGFTAHEAIAFMRIVRPGSVVGPQQQYMYVKQMEWAKWAAVDEMRRAEAQTAAAIAAASVITPATPPAETDDEIGMDALEAVPVVPSTPKKGGIPPVTPNKHVNTATARARQIEPPGQPRKTPVAKRSAADAVEESEEEGSEDELNALPSSTMMTSSGAATRGRIRAVPTLPLRGTARRTQISSEQRPARVTRSVASSNTTHARRPTTNSHTPSSSVPTVVPSSPVKGATNGPSPNKIPRIARRPVSPPPPARSTTSMGTRSRLQPPGAVTRPGSTPSRLPTLAATGRRANTAQGVVTRAAATKSGSKLDSIPAGKGAKEDKDGGDNAWMKNNPSAVVVPGSKGERPGLRSVRRRRSSFSAADIVT